MVVYGIAYKFNPNTEASNPWEELEGTEMTKEAMEYNYVTSGFGVYGDRIRRNGWEIPIFGLKTYVVKTTYDGWTEHVSPNKTMLRKKLLGTGVGPILKIVEVV